MDVRRQIVWVAALAIAGCQWLGALRPLAAQNVPSAPVEHATRQHAFTIPFRIEPARSPAEQPVEVQLHVSADQGATWEVASRVKPDKGSFVYRAPHDGEYWYAIRTVDARGAVKPEGQLTPQLKVWVDTVAPRLDIIASRGEAGEVVVRWQAVDPYLKPSSFKLEYQSGPGAPWERVAVETRPNAMRHTTSGEATWWPKPGSGNVTVRAEITDLAGNPAHNQAVVKVDPQAPDPPRSASAGDKANAAAQGNAAANKSAAPDAGEANDEWRHAAPAEPRDERAPRVAAQPVSQPVSQPVDQPKEAVVTASPLDFTVVPSGERARMVNVRNFELEYELESVGSSGVSKVELWGTRDGGRTWQVFGVDTDNQSPLNVKVDHEGVYGFRIAVVSGSGLGGQPPAEGDLADLWIGVDLTKPVGTLSGAEPSDDGSELVITWDAGDDALDVRPITLSFSEAARGPWTPIASGLENTGSYTWHIEGKVPALVYLRLEIRDEAGNVTTIDRPEPVSLDRSRPEGRIRGVKPVGKAARVTTVR